MKQKIGRLILGLVFVFLCIFAYNLWQDLRVLLVKIPIPRGSTLTEELALQLSKEALIERDLLGNLKARPAYKVGDQESYLGTNVYNSQTGTTIWEAAPGERNNCYVVRITLEAELAIAEIGRCLREVT